MTYDPVNVVAVVTIPPPLGHCLPGMKSVTGISRCVIPRTHVEGDTLMFLPEYPIIERLDFGPAESVFVEGS
jgi:hypothetical protein